MSSPPELNHHQTKAVRLLRLLELLQQKPWRPVELRAELGLGERAIFDYLNEAKALAEQWGLRFIHDPRRSTYAIELEERLSLTETVVAFTALRMLAHHSPGSNQAYQEALRKLAKGLPEPLKALALKSTEALNNRPPSLSGANLETLTQGWLLRQAVAFEYRIPSSRTIKVELETYFIEVSRANMAVYIIGRDRLYGRGIHYLENLRTYKLERIQRPRLLDNTYLIPDDFDPTAYLSTAWGILGGDPLRVLLRFSPEASERLREGGYPNLQILEQLEGGYTLAQITVGTNTAGFPLELLPWIQSWGPRVEVLEPPSLRQVWLDEARALVERFSAAQAGPSPRVYWGHSHPDPNRWQPLRVHLENVARLAAERAAPFAEEPSARLAGYLHDLGKYGDRFQLRLEGKARGLDHWSAGAHVALFDYRLPAVALAVQGHHIGLQSGAKEQLKAMWLRSDGHGTPPELKLSEPNKDLLTKRLQDDGLTLPTPAPTSPMTAPSRAADMLDTRMLFSALVDADFLDTEAHLHGAIRPQAPSLQVGQALSHLEAHLEVLAQDERLPERIRALRKALSDAAAEAARRPERVFTLTAPTGLGKTLAMLRFALRRAMRDPRIRRIVVVLPYLSILDQTAEIYRGLFAGFGPHYILEDHSLAYRPLRKELSDEQDLAELERRLLAENWEASIILTTNVQLLESLHANRPGACRKLHNLAGSVLLFDEVQTLPTHLAVPTLKTLAHLASEKYGAVVVFATATQPAFDTLHPRVQAGEPQGWQPVEMAPAPEVLFQQSRRVQVEWWLKNPTTPSHLLTLLEADPQALVVLNLKRQAHALFRQAAEKGLKGLYHLSTALCPAHRLKVLEEVKDRLMEGQPCRLISTQVVEAGVELDFPVGYRALAPLEAIAQTAGRINRHGLRHEGRLVVFVPEDEGYPDKAYQQAARLTRALQAEGELTLEPTTFRRYYQSLYALQNVSDPEIENLIQTQNYAELARRYRLIETAAVNVVVPYSDEALALMQEARNRGIAADWIHRARPYTVPFFLPKGGPPALLETVFLRYGRGEAPDWYLCPDPALYDALLGFTPEEDSAAGLVI